MNPAFRFNQSKTNALYVTQKSSTINKEPYEGIQFWLRVVNVFNAFNKRKRTRVTQSEGFTISITTTKYMKHIWFHLDDSYTIDLISLFHDKIAVDRIGTKSMIIASIKQRAKSEDDLELSKNKCFFFL